MSEDIVEVVVGVLIDAQNNYLLTTRPPGKVYAGYWEFPGGKVEAGETIQEALTRELFEELGIHIQSAEPWREHRVDYAHARVRLHICKVREWTGHLQMKEGQAYSWESLPVQVHPVLPGTLPILDWLVNPALET